MDVRGNTGNDSFMPDKKFGELWFSNLFSFAGAFASDELHAGLCHTFLFNHIRQMVLIIDADAKTMVSAGKAARWAGSRWALPHIYLSVKL